MKLKETMTLGGIRFADSCEYPTNETTSVAVPCAVAFHVTESNETDVFEIGVKPAGAIDVVVQASRLYFWPGNWTIGEDVG